MRTNALVAVGAAAFVDFGIRIGGPASTQVMAYVVSGIGFLGAGAIMREGLNVRGLNTAATLWCSAAVGAGAGAGLVVESAMLTGFVIAGNTLLRPLVNRINRIPIDEEAGEATYEVRLSVTAAEADDAREALIEALEAAHYPSPTSRRRRAATIRWTSSPRSSRPRSCRKNSTRSPPAREGSGGHPRDLGERGAGVGRLRGRWSQGSGSRRPSADPFGRPRATRLWRRCAAPLALSPGVAAVRSRLRFRSVFR